MEDHQDRKFQLVTERMRAIGELHRMAEETRGLAIKNNSSESRLAALNAGINQLDQMRQVIDVKYREIKTSREVLKLECTWVKPLENGYGYPAQFPKRAWDAFQALLGYIPANERKAIRLLPIGEDERAEENFANASSHPVCGADCRIDSLGGLIQWLLSRSDYPRQGSPLHNRFVDDVFPRIKAALKSAEEQFAKDLDEAFGEKAKVVESMLKVGETSA